MILQGENFIARASAMSLEMHFSQNHFDSILYYS